MPDAKNTPPINEDRILTPSFNLRDVPDDVGQSGFAEYLSQLTTQMSQDLQARLLTPEEARSFEGITNMAATTSQDPPMHPDLTSEDLVRMRTQLLSSSGRPNRNGDIFLFDSETNEQEQPRTGWYAYETQGQPVIGPAAAMANFAAAGSTPEEELGNAVDEMVEEMAEEDAAARRNRQARAATQWRDTFDSERMRRFLNEWQAQHHQPPLVDPGHDVQLDIDTEGIRADGADPAGITIPFAELPQNQIIYGDRYYVPMYPVDPRRHQSGAVPAPSRYLIERGTGTVRVPLSRTIWRDRPPRFVTLPDGYPGITVAFIGQDHFDLLFEAEGEFHGGYIRWVASDHENLGDVEARPQPDPPPRNIPCVWQFQSPGRWIKMAGATCSCRPPSRRGEFIGEVVLTCGEYAVEGDVKISASSPQPAQAEPEVSQYRRKVMRD